MPTTEFNRSNTTITFPTASPAIPSINTGIVNGSMSVREIMCTDGLVFGECNANEFQADVYNCPDILNQRIRVTQVDDGVTTYVFNGYVTSCKIDETSGFRRIIAYDRFYKFRARTVKRWWTSFWENRETATFRQIWTGICDFVNVSYDNSTSLILDNVSISRPKHWKRLRVQKLTSIFNQLCELNLCIPKMDRSGQLYFIQFTHSTIDSATPVDITGNYMPFQSKFEDTVVEPYDGVELFNDKDESVLVEDTGNKVLSIQNNMFLYGQKDTKLTEIATIMQANLFQTSYIPAQIVMKVSDLNIKLGDFVRTTKGLCLVCENDYTGSLLVNQSIVSNFADKTEEASVSHGNNLVRDGERQDYKIGALENRAQPFCGIELPDDEEFKSGDLWIKETHKTIADTVKKVFGAYQTYNDAVNNTYWYSYNDVTVTCDCGNFAIMTAHYTNTQGRGFVVAGSMSRPLEHTFFVVKVPKTADDPTENDVIPSFTGVGAEGEEFNTGRNPKGLFWCGENGLPFFYNPALAIANNSGTYYYYWASVAAGTFCGGLRRETERIVNDGAITESNVPDYEFDTRSEFENALRTDVVNISDIYIGEETNQLKYNDGTGGTDAWKNLKYVKSVDTSEGSGGQDNNGLKIDEVTSKISLKPNVMRAALKPDTPQSQRKFTQFVARYTGKPDEDVSITAYANYGFTNDAVKQDDDNAYKIVCKGVGGSGHYCVYAISGLVIDTTYYFNFSVNFSDRATFGGDITKGLGVVFNTTGVVDTDAWTGNPDTFDSAQLYYSARRTTTKNYADFKFKATATTMYMCVVTFDVTSTSNITLTLAEFVISKSERNYMRRFWLYDTKTDNWLEYKPFGGVTSSGGESGGGSVVTITPTLQAGVKIADYSIDGDEGELYAPQGGSYTLPIASATELGGIKVGQNLSIDANGVLNATGGGGGTSDLDAIELTYAEYQALTPAEKTDPDKIYFITDYPSGSGVVINPTGSATDTAETIEVDGTISTKCGATQIIENTGGNTPLRLKGNTTYTFLSFRDSADSHLGSIGVDSNHRPQFTYGGVTTYIALTTDNVASATKATQDGDGNTISSTYTKVRTTTDSANYNTALNISAYDATKPIFGYVSVITKLSAGANFYIPFSFMKDVVPAGTHDIMGVQGAYSFLFQFTDSPRSIKMVQARDANGNDATTNNTIKFYLYRNY